MSVSTNISLFGSNHMACEGDITVKLLRDKIVTKKWKANLLLLQHNRQTTKVTLGVL